MYAHIDNPFLSANNAYCNNTITIRISGEKKQKTDKYLLCGDNERHPKGQGRNQEFVQGGHKKIYNFATSIFFRVGGGDGVCLPLPPLILSV